ncbi:putative endopeptidase [Lachnospiraceae bacterium]|nr:putative endopeptidase [Lachnospiraceae bacterium]
MDFACQFIGNPYVWGGTSLTNGADCSGFVQSVYAHFGISLPRTTRDLVSVGTPVSYDQAIPGDIILYDGHVGIYMGNGQIVNAINSAQGIGILPATYTSIVTVRRLI